jgi:hypothetical protein
MATAPGLEVRPPAECLEVAQGVVAGKDHITAAPAVTAVGPTLGHVRLATEAQTAIAAAAGLYVDSCSIVHRSSLRLCRFAARSRRT